MTTLIAVSKTSRLTGVTLASLAGLHAAWGLGSSFPFRERLQLADAVVGTTDVPPRSACFAVACLLALASATVLKIVPLPRAIRRVALASLAGVFILRASAGLIGKTDLLSPGSNSERFKRLDRQFYSPLCLVLALGALRAWRD